MTMPTYSPLDRPAQFLKGVGPRRSESLAKLGLLTARDVLYHVPRRYEDASTVQPIRSLEPGMEATVIGRIVSKGVLPTRKGLRIFQAVLRDRTGLIECSWPGQPFLDRSFREGDLLLVSGPVRFFHGRQIQPREHVVLARAGEAGGGRTGKVFPVYPATEGLPQWQIRKLLADNLDELLAEARDADSLPASIRESLSLPDLETAFRALHRPERLAEVEIGRQRLAFDELFYLQLLHARTHFQQSREVRGIAFERRDTLVRPFFESLPFELTDAQRRVLGEIGADMTSPRRMNRLLQGDVGAGKTVVALLAMLRAVENGYQAALMAPTEVLAEQHLNTLRALIGELPVRVQLLTGRMGAAARRTALAAIASGEAQIVVGTHALIQEAVAYHRLGLAVVDEQHRFGVRQRLVLAEVASEREGEERPDVLLMSATPIPRSLALTLYGDLDLSVLDERPAGRRPVRTALRPASARPAVMEFVRDQVRAGRQAFFVFPLVEESEAIELKAATEEYETLQDDVFPELRLGLLHGQMPGEEKERVMHAFRDRELDILVATTVIEVGIDVPNATVMVIEHAERFGLSQLHQLRGRVGRGGEQSYCILLQGHPGRIERLHLFASTEDGFQIAEEDMRLRGQGDLFGERQSGIPAFRFADLARDATLLQQARELARQLVEEDVSLAAYPSIREELEQRYGEQARLYRAG